MSDRISLAFTVNGRSFDLELEPRRTLADTLRDNCGLTGTHIGCEHGVCGTCTALVDGAPVRSCLMFAVQAQGTDIRTVESLSSPDELHPLQQMFIDKHALQCGYCTPGFLMLTIGLIEQNPAISDAELKEHLASNLCRCTGYQNIVAAVIDYARNERSAGEAQHG